MRQWICDRCQTCIPSSADDEEHVFDANEHDNEGEDEKDIDIEEAVSAEDHASHNDEQDAQSTSPTEMLEDVMSSTRRLPNWTKGGPFVAPLDWRTARWTLPASLQVWKPKGQCWNDPWRQKWSQKYISICHTKRLQKLLLFMQLFEVCEFFFFSNYRIY